MKNMRPADYAWLTMAAGIVAYEVAARDGDLLSDGWDRYATHEKPWVATLAKLAPFIVAGHLSNAWPNWADPIHLGFVGIRKLRRLI